jgi:hypothetical protein
MCTDGYGLRWYGSQSDFLEATLQGFMKSTQLPADTSTKSLHIPGGSLENLPLRLGSLTNRARSRTLGPGARKTALVPNKAHLKGLDMKHPRVLIALTVINLALLLIAVLQQGRPAFAAGAASVLRGSALEIVDGQGRVRASLNVLPAGKSQNGEVYQETVLLRLITERGRPSVKIGASEETAGLSFAGPTNTKSTYVILESKGRESSLTLRNEDGHQQMFKP